MRTRIIACLNTKYKHDFTHYRDSQLADLFELNKRGVDLWQFLNTPTSIHFVRLAVQGVDFSEYDLLNMPFTDQRTLLKLLGNDLNPTIMKKKNRDISSLVKAELVRHLLADGKDYTELCDYTKLTEELALNYIHWLDSGVENNDFLKKFLIHFPVSRKELIYEFLNQGYPLQSLIRAKDLFKLKEYVTYLEKVNLPINKDTLPPLANIREIYYPILAYCQLNGLPYPDTSKTYYLTLCILLNSKFPVTPDWKTILDSSFPSLLFTLRELSYTYGYDYEGLKQIILNHALKSELQDIYMQALICGCDITAYHALNLEESELLEIVESMLEEEEYNYNAQRVDILSNFILGKYRYKFRSDDK